jgi:hypothetical protein
LDVAQGQVKVKPPDSNENESEAEGPQRERRRDISEAKPWNAVPNQRQRQQVKAQAEPDNRMTAAHAAEARFKT